ncbi:SDR family NAD(P)-dependent oxidoreductase [Oenococcus sp.]|uniref:SDR family NAD(P)-dependent oxidoreductase n=1 Tax=Oenococcus sp. TaxID=1979414 RepID=UPI0039E9A33F
MKLKEKVAIVTGGTSGIGEASAILFAAEGAKVVVAGRNQENGRAVVQHIKDQGGEAVFVQADMLNTDDIDKLLNTTIEAYGKIDILFNNAGISVAKPLEEMTYEEFDNVMDTNLKAPFQMCKQAMPYLMKTKGTILNTSSIAGLSTNSNSYAYSASKSALISLTKVLARDYAAKGVRVNAICPGITETPILNTVNGEQMSYLEAIIPMQRVGQPIEIAKPALFLVSDDASYITGSTLVVDGGITLV